MANKAPAGKACCRHSSQRGGRCGAPAELLPAVRTEPREPWERAALQHEMGVKTRPEHRALRPRSAASDGCRSTAAKGPKPQTDGAKGSTTAWCTTAEDGEDFHTLNNPELHPNRSVQSVRHRAQGSVHTAQEPEQSSARGTPQTHTAARRARSSLTRGYLSPRAPCSGNTPTQSSCPRDTGRTSAPCGQPVSIRGPSLVQHHLPLTREPLRGRMPSSPERWGPSPGKPAATAQTPPRAPGWRRALSFTQAKAGPARTVSNAEEPHPAAGQGGHGVSRAGPPRGAVPARPGVTAAPSSAARTANACRAGAKRVCKRRGSNSSRWRVLRKHSLKYTDKPCRAQILGFFFFFFLYSRNTGGFGLPSFPSTLRREKAENWSRRALFLLSTAPRDGPRGSEQSSSELCTAPRRANPSGPPPAPLVRAQRPTSRPVLLLKALLLKM